MTRTIPLTLTFLAAATAACHRAEPAPAAPRAVRVERAAPAQTAADLRYSAGLQPREQVVLAFKVGGYVEQLARRDGPDGRPRALQPGDLVRAGEPLARLRQADHAQRVAQARAQLAGAEATAARAAAEAERAQRLYDAQSLTRVDYDAAMAARAVSAAQAEAARADLASATLALADCTLRAPMDAVVLSRSVEAGALVSPGTPAFAVADVSRLKAVFGMPERVARGLRVGQPLALDVEARPGQPLAGQVTAIAPVADAHSRVFSVEVTVDDRGRELRAGTVATARVATGGPPGPRPAAVPLAAVVRSPARPEGYAVFVVGEADGRPVARAREVRLGEIRGNHVEVDEGLAQGDRVVVVGATLLTDGEQVAVLE